MAKAVASSPGPMLNVSVHAFCTSIATTSA